MSLDPSAVWRPRGVLIAHLAEHRRAVNCLSVAGKDRHNPFFVSASNDGTVKVCVLTCLLPLTFFDELVLFLLERMCTVVLINGSTGLGFGNNICLGWEVVQMPPRRKGPLSSHVVFPLSMTVGLWFFFVGLMIWALSVLLGVGFETSGTRCQFPQ